MLKDFHPLRKPFGILFSVIVAWGGFLGADVPAAQAGDEPLHAAVDRMILAKAGETADQAAPIASDAEFLRRVTLDLTGQIPTSEAARKFLADDDPEKRAKLIDQLLDSPEYARHMQHVFDVLLMRRLRDKHVDESKWQEFLRESFAKNKPWDQITREILSADGSDPKNRGPARFYLDREGDIDAITRDIARIFLGADLECAQCHDHPEVADYLQRHYYGISAFLVRSFVFDPKDKKKPVFAEKAEGEVSFQSVFEATDKKSKGKTTLPRIFDSEPVEEVSFKKGEEYKVKPAKNVRPIPKYSRREQLGDAIIHAANDRFSRTAANRLWAMMMGRGLVDPVDLDHSDNPPSHPELLDRLTAAFKAGGYDVKAYLRELALSDAYQRSSRRIVDGAETAPLDESLFLQAILKPLSPEQFAWAVVQATGEADVQRRALGDKLSEATLYEKLDGYQRIFERQFGGQPGKPPEDFESTVDQVLFLSNDNTVWKLISPKSGNLADRLLKLPTDAPDAIAEELFLSVLTREPSEQDRQDVRDYLAGLSGDERQSAIKDLIWALVTSPEFRFNH